MDPVKHEPGRNRAGKIVPALLLAAAAVCAVLIMFYAHREARIRRAEETFRSFVEETETEAEPETGAPPVRSIAQKIDFPALWEINPDAYAFIEIPDTEVFYPVLQSTTQEEDHYLNVTFEGVTGLPGSIYTQMVNARDFSDRLTVIYGHDMRDNSYFGGLDRYANPDYFESHRALYIWLPERQLEYDVIAEVRFDNRLISYYFDVTSPQAMTEFWAECHNGSPDNVFAEDSADITPEDRLLILSTCMGNEETRRLIIARLVGDTPCS